MYSTAPGGVPVPEPSPAAGWLPAGFDATDIEELICDVRVPACPQPMFALKDVMHPGAAMRVTGTGCDDSLRWRL